MQTDLVRGIEYVYAERSNPLVFALTGRTGSGCTTAATSLGRHFGEIQKSAEDLQQPEHRKVAIALEYAGANWTPFTSITVSSVIFSLLLDEDLNEIESYLISKDISKEGRDELHEHLGYLKSDPSCFAFRKAMRDQSSNVEQATAWHFFDTSICPLASQSRKVLGAQYSSLFQSLGNNVRFSGRCLDTSIRPDQLFLLMDRVRRLIECIVASRRASDDRPVRVVIDAIRNPLELVYLRKHVVGLYVVAVTADDKERRARLMEGVLGKKEVDAIDAKECGGRRHLTDYESFVSQNLTDCIQKADIFVANPGLPGQIASSVRFMNTQLVRYVALALRPGLITPTRDERLMQIAFVAKLNSGCISRQVGAVVADEDHSIHALGWNDTPKGQTTCLLRDVHSLLSGTDSDSFSEFEKTDSKLRSHLEKQFATRDQLKIQGLRCPFCFKDAYNYTEGKQNQVHTRSLHAEENAFLQLVRRGSPGIAGGMLFTTASPCELCSKKAYQLGIRDIVYVDPYPGISMTHVLASGLKETRPRLRLFSGAVGHAYHRLYEPILSIKDEYRARLDGATNAPSSLPVALDEERNLTLF